MACAPLTRPPFCPRKSSPHPVSAELREGVGRRKGEMPNLVGQGCGFLDSVVTFCLVPHWRAAPTTQEWTPGMSQDMGSIPKDEPLASQKTHPTKVGWLMWEPSFQLLERERPLDSSTPALGASSLKAEGNSVRKQNPGRAFPLSGPLAHLPAGTVHEDGWELPSVTCGPGKANTFVPWGLCGPFEVPGGHSYPWKGQTARCKPSNVRAGASRGLPVLEIAPLGDLKFSGRTGLIKGSLWVSSTCRLCGGKHTS
ncbi:hypothetical protein Cadr_000014049 [Camelus dromedarius]|uniref:Uncharacterized protein n=1 Tax=Camelus dromedarius TaxID=9838 RepID=A0A5N4DDY7_CAMDR|nr:hypothetical protein Cadr_000014049 [Camelus dromedarius]